MERSARPLAAWRLARGLAAGAAMRGAGGLPRCDAGTGALMGKEVEEGRPIESHSCLACAGDYLRG